MEVRQLYKTFFEQDVESTASGTRKIQFRRRFITALKIEQGCVRCSESDPVVLDLDHINPLDKTYPIHKALFKSEDKFLRELEKCQVLCANCHRRKTANEDIEYLRECSAKGRGALQDKKDLWKKKEELQTMVKEVLGHRNITAPLS